MRILIVDDDSSVRITMAGVLEDAGNTVFEAEDGYQAIELVKKNDYDIIFMDIKMPGINGVDTYLEIKKMKKKSAVIMMTAFSVEDLIEKAINEGAYTVLHKPFDMNKALELIAGLKNPAILITDDELSTRDMLKLFLEEKGYRIETAENGKEAVEKVKAGNIDIVFMDVKMPEMDGLQTLKIIRQKFPLVEVVMLTGHATIESAIEGMKLGAFDYLMKPCDMEDLLSKVREAAMKKRRQKEKIVEAQLKEITMRRV